MDTGRFSPPVEATIGRRSGSNFGVHSQSELYSTLSAPPVENKALVAEREQFSLEIPTPQGVTSNAKSKDKMAHMAAVIAASLDHEKG